MKELEGLLNNMVIGNGQIAKFFNDFKNNQDILIFASGVSNSNCTNLKEFKRFDYDRSRIKSTSKSRADNQDNYEYCIYLSVNNLLILKMQMTETYQ